MQSELLPNGPNDTVTFQSGKGQNIQQWIMLVPMPVDIDLSDYIQTFALKFQELCKKLYIHSAYKSGVSGITQHTGMLNQISQDGNYWNIVENAVQNNIIFKSANCLSEFLLDKTINEVVSLMFDVNTDKTTWPEPIQIYAYGH